MSSLFGNISKGSPDSNKNEPVNNSTESNNIQPESQTPNVFSLLNQQTENSTQNSPALMDTIIQQKDSKTESNSILDSSAFQQLSNFTPSTTVKEEQFFTLSKIFAIFLVSVLAILHIFFYTQLTPEFNLFGANVYKKWENGREKVQQSYNELLVRRLILAQIKLDTILNFAQDYKEKKTPGSKSAIITYYDDLKNLLNVARYPAESLDMYPSEIDADNSYSQSFLDSIDAEIADLKTKQSEEQTQEEKITMQVLETVKKLYQRKPVRTAILALDLNEENFDEKIGSLVNEVNNLSVTNFALITQIRGSRVDWDPIIKNITKITQQVDPNHASKRFRNLSTIEYSAFSLDNKNLTISGILKTKDSKNFTQIANLIDLFEKDSMFKDVSAQSFSKSFDQENEFFFSAIQIELTLQDGEDERDLKENLSNNV